LHGRKPVNQTCPNDLSANDGKKISDDRQETKKREGGEFAGFKEVGKEE